MAEENNFADMNENMSQPIANNSELFFSFTDPYLLNDLSNSASQEIENKNVPNIERNCFDTLNLILTSVADVHDEFNASGSGISEGISKNDSVPMAATSMNGNSSDDWENSCSKPLHKLNHLSFGEMSLDNDMFKSVPSSAEKPVSAQSNLNCNLTGENKQVNTEPLSTQNDSNGNLGENAQVNTERVLSRDNLSNLSGENMLLNLDLMHLQDNPHCSSIEKNEPLKEKLALSQGYSDCNLSSENFYPNANSDCEKLVKSSQVSNMPNSANASAGVSCAQFQDYIQRCTTDGNEIGAFTSNSIASPLVLSFDNDLSNVSISNPENVTVSASNCDLTMGSSVDILTNESNSEFSVESSDAFLASIPVESSKIIDCFEVLEDTKSEVTGISGSTSMFQEDSSQIPISNIDNDEEEFTDAVQFFKDPSTFQYLESIRTSVALNSTLPRSSLYVNFDPLLKTDNPKNLTDAFQHSGSIKDSPNETIDNDAVPVNKQLDKTARESIGTNLLSFDSPQTGNKTEIVQPDLSTLQKLYTEEEKQQLLKIHELMLQETYLKQHRAHEEEMRKMEHEKDSTIKRLGDLCKIQKQVIEDVFAASVDNATRNKNMRMTIEKLEEENSSLKQELKTSSEDLQSVENTFSDFHKRYEQCKAMLKTYKDNEAFLKEEIENSKVKLNQQEQMYNALQERTEEMLEKANSEVSCAKKSNDAQVAVLKAQLKKAELKISSLESDIKQVRVENSKLGGICDDLMAKIHEA